MRYIPQFPWSFYNEMSETETKGSYKSGVHFANYHKYSWGNSSSGEIGCLTGQDEDESRFPITAFSGTLSKTIFCGGAVEAWACSPVDVDAPVASPDDFLPLSISLLPDDANVVLLPYGSRELWTDMERPPVDRRALFGLSFAGSTELGSA